VNLVLDSTVVGVLCHPRHPEHAALSRWLSAMQQDPWPGSQGVRVFLPEVVDYELRRKLLHLAFRAGVETHPGITRLDTLGTLLSYLPLTTTTMRLAATLWAQARASGRPTAPNEALDSDAILAAQSLGVGGTVITDNVRHLSQFGPAARWQDVAVPAPPRRRRR